MEILAKSPRPLSVLMADLPKTFATPEIGADVSDTVIRSVIEGELALVKADH